MGNQRKLVAAIITYAGENQGMLPVFSTQNASGGWVSEDFWEQKVLPYLDVQVDSAKFTAVGDTFMRCPSAPKGSGATYGVNYPIAFGQGNFMFPQMKLANMPGSSILTTDVEGLNAFYSPIVFPFNSSSGDYGKNDSYGSAKFNFTRPRHAGKLICSFADGHIEAVPMLDFIENKNKMWGLNPWAAQ